MNELSALPPVWAEKLACNICNIVDTEDLCNNTTECEDIRECETTTSLTDFEVIGNTVCISFTDEHGVKVKRCFEYSHLLNEIDNTDGICISPLWEQLSAKDKWQAVIDKVCNCCNPTTTTTTTSTTTTTTIAPCNDCYTFTVYNPDIVSHDITFIDCDDIVTLLTVNPGETMRYCSCPDNIPIADVELIINSIATECLPDCIDCTEYTLENTNVYPIFIEYVECGYGGIGLPTSIWILPSEIISICACTGSITVPTGVIMITGSLCDVTTTTSTTTTTTSVPCICYTITNPEPEIDRYVMYKDCNGNDIVTGIADTLNICAQEGTVSGFGLIIFNTEQECIAGECPTTTTTTTSTSTTTTSTTTTTTTSTTTTTTAAPIIENDIVYFTNTPTNGDRGAKIWFSQNDYYTPNTPASVIAANCLSTVDLGTNPSITIVVDYWQDDVFGTIDDGFGSKRAPDGNKTITISSDLLVYNGSSGAWQRSNGIFTLSEGANIAAFEIVNISTNYIYNGVDHVFQLPPADHLIRVHNTFLAGATSVIWFDLS